MKLNYAQKLKAKDNLVKKLNNKVSKSWLNYLGYS